MANETLHELLTLIDEQIQIGKLQVAQNYLLSLKKSEIPFKFWLEIANLGRRAQLPYFVLKWLNSIIRPEKESDEHLATSKHISLYANALARIGSFQEAESLFNSISHNDDTQIYFYKALLNMQRWDYQKAVSNLKKFIHQPNLNEQQLNAGHLNLAASLCAVGDYEDSLSIIEKIINKVPSNSIIKGILLETQGQNLMHLNKFKEAQIILENAIQIFDNSNHSFKIYAEKWLILNKIKQISNPTVEDLSELLKLKVKALEQSQWETVRDCDLYFGYFTKNNDLLLKIFFGTRHSKFKNRIIKNFNLNLNIPDRFKMILNQSSIKNPVILDPQTGLFHNSEVQFLQHLPLKFFRLLTSDIYLPFHVGEIFSELYQGEYFNPNSSPQKINRLIHRLREDLLNNKIQIDIKVFRKQLYLVYKDNIILLLNFKKRKSFSKLKEYISLKNNFDLLKFDVNSAEKILQTSRRNTNRILQSLVKEKLVLINKEGRKTNYKINHKIKKIS